VDRDQAHAKLGDARADVAQWLKMMSDACLIEQDHLERGGDVADADLMVDWNLLLESIEKFREAQADVKQVELDEEEAEADREWARLEAESEGRQ
jgi:hypothetical protein